MMPIKVQQYQRIFEKFQNNQTTKTRSKKTCLKEKSMKNHQFMFCALFTSNKKYHKVNN
jgi:hypothetical protein